MAESAKFKRIEAEEIVVRMPGSDKNVTISAGGNGIGVWINGATVSRGMISLYIADHGEMCIGLRSPRASELSPYNLALTIDQETGEPTVQLTGLDGEVMIVTYDELKNLREPLTPADMLRAIADIPMRNLAGSKLYFIAASGERFPVGRVGVGYDEAIYLAACDGVSTPKLFAHFLGELLAHGPGGLNAGKPVSFIEPSGKRHRIDVVVVGTGSKLRCGRLSIEKTDVPTQRTESL